jgi:hypothetical protein
VGGYGGLINAVSGNKMGRVMQEMGVKGPEMRLLTIEKYHVFHSV